MSSILTRTNFVTLKYVTDNWGTDVNGFKLVITSVKDPSKYSNHKKETNNIIQRNIYKLK